MKKNISFFIVVILFLVVFLFIKRRESNLKNRGIILNAKTLEWISGAKMSMDLKYEFYYKGRKIIGNNATGSFRGNREFENRYFPVIYDPKLRMNELLITPEDFKKYSLSFPDSLKWVLPYLK